MASLWRFTGFGQAIGWPKVIENRRLDPTKAELAAGSPGSW
jgi:hypothetical protein